MFYPPEQCKQYIDTIIFERCRDSQTSADAQFGGLPSGALSYAFIRAFGESDIVNEDGGP